MEKWIIMQELEDSNTPMPYLIMNDEEKANKKAEELEKKLPEFIFWVCACDEEEE